MSIVLNIPREDPQEVWGRTSDHSPMPRSPASLWESRGWHNGDIQLETEVLKFMTQAVRVLGVKAMSGNQRWRLSSVPVPTQSTRDRESREDEALPKMHSPLSEGLCSLKINHSALTDSKLNFRERTQGIILCFKGSYKYLAQLLTKNYSYLLWSIYSIKKV